MVYPRPSAGRASYCQATRRWVKTASPLGIGPYCGMLTVRCWGNLVLIQYFGGGGINLFFGQIKQQLLICLPGDSLQHLCSFRASPYRQCPKCHVWSKAQPKRCEGIAVCPPHIAHATEMDAKMVVFPQTLETPQSHLPFPHINYIGKKNKSLESRFCGNGPSLEAAAPDAFPSDALWQRLAVMFWWDVNV